MSSADVEAAIIDGRVPSDVSATYLNQTRDPETIVAISIIFALATVVLGCRCWARVTILKRFGLDDALAVLAWVSVLIRV